MTTQQALACFSPALIHQAFRNRNYAEEKFRLANACLRSPGAGAAFAYPTPHETYVAFAGRQKKIARTPSPIAAAMTE
jgi:hypothetical protein